MDIDETQQDVQAENKKLVLHGPEYEKFKTAILHTVKLFESQGNKINMIKVFKIIYEYI